MNERYFKVRGSWPFPYDMLRYDACHPASESQSAIIADLEHRTTDAGVVEIEMIGHNLHAPTHRRWESFCWKVI